MDDAFAAPFGGIWLIYLPNYDLSEIMRRISASMVGAMVRATLLTLLLLPATFLAWRSRDIDK